MVLELGANLFGGRVDGRLGRTRRRGWRRTGWRLSRPGETFRLSVDADRRENADDPGHGIGLKLDTRW